MDFFWSNTYGHYTFSLMLLNNFFIYFSSFFFGSWYKRRYKHRLGVNIRVKIICLLSWSDCWHPCDNVLSLAKFSVYLNDASITTTEGQLKPSWSGLMDEWMNEWMNEWNVIDKSLDKSRGQHTVYMSAASSDVSIQGCNWQPLSVHWWAYCNPRAHDMNDVCNEVNHTIVKLS